MAQLRLSFDEVASELRIMAQLADGPFLDAAARYRLEAAADQLRHVRNARGGIWEVPICAPIVTAYSPGVYAQDGKGAHTIYAELSWIWQIACDPRDRDALILKDHASMRVVFKRVLNDGDQQVICWTMDVADKNAPGAYVHTQVKNTLPNEEPELDVPRFPTVLITPGECLDFVLGELFQKKWQQHQTLRREDTTNLRRAQRKRMKLFLEDILRSAHVRYSDATAWMAFKLWKPDNLSLTSY